RSGDLRTCPGVLYQRRVSWRHRHERAHDYLRRADDGTAGAAADYHQRPGSDPRSARLDTPGQLRCGCDQVADGLAPCAAAGHSRHLDRHNPGDVARDRRDGPADCGGRLDLHCLRSQRAILQIHGAADSNLRLDVASGTTIQKRGVGGDPGAAGAAADAECPGDLVAQSFSQEYIMSFTAGATMRAAATAVTNEQASSDLA